MLRSDRKQQNSVKQLSFNKKMKRKEKQKKKKDYFKCLQLNCAKQVVKTWECTIKEN